MICQIDVVSKQFSTAEPDIVLSGLVQVDAKSPLANELAGTGIVLARGAPSLVAEEVTGETMLGAALH